MNAKQNPTNESESDLIKKLQHNPEIAKLMQEAEQKTQQAENASCVENPLLPNKGDKELAPGNPRSLEQMEKVNPRKEGEDPADYLDRIFG